MPEEDNSLEGGNTRAEYTQGLETAPPEVSKAYIRRRPSLFKFNRLAFMVTGGALLAIGLVVVAGLVLSGIRNKDDAISSQKGKFNVTKLSVNSVEGNEQLKVGNADKLSVNGQLKVSNTLILAPTDAPDAPTIGQIYYSKTNNTLYYFNGQTFVPIANNNAIVSSLGGLTGAINTGTGLSAVGGTLQNTGVTSVQGQTGAVNFTAGGGVSISGTTVALTALPAGQLVLGTGSSGFTSVAQASTPGQCLISTAGAPVFGSCTGTTLVTSLNGLINGLTLAAGSGINITNNGSNTITIAAPASAAITSINSQTGPALTVANATAAGNIITINNAAADGSTKGIAAFNAINFIASSGVINTIQGISTTASPTFANLTSSGYLKGTELRNGTDVVFTLPVTGSGASRTLCYVDNTNSSNCPTGGNISSGTSQTPGYLTKFDSTTNNITDSELLVLSGGLQYAGTSYLLDLASASNSTLTVDNSGAGVANLAISGKLSASQGFLQGSDTFTLPSNGGNGGVLCYVYSGSSNCPTGGNVSFGTTHTTNKIAALDGSGNLVDSELSTLIGGIQYAGTAYLLDLTSGSNSTLTVDNSGAGVANLSVSGSVTANGGVILASGKTLQAAAGGVELNAGTGVGDTITFYTANGANSFILPTTGGMGQTICTTAITCAAGGGQAVLLEPGASPQSSAAATAAIYISKTSGATGNLLQLQYNGSDRFVINSRGELTSFRLNAGTAGTDYVTVQSASQTGVVNLSVPTVSAGSYDLCLSSGNCAGSGGGITGSGSANTIAMFTGSGTIGNSALSQASGNITASGDLVVQGGDLTLGVASSQTGSLSFKHSGSTFTGNIIQGGLTGNQTYTLPDSTGDFCLSSGNCIGGGGGGAPNGASYLTVSSDGTLSAERVLTAGTNISIADAGANSTLTVSVVTNPTFAGLITANGGLTVETGDTFTFNGDAFTDLTGTGLTVSSGSLQTTLGISVDLASEVIGILPVANGGIGIGTLASNGILYGNGTSAIQATAAAANSILATNGSNVPSLTQTLPTAVQGNITSTGTLASGSIASGFGAISTGNNITTSATLQGATVNATSQIQLNGTDINTAGTLSNLAYLNAASNTFTGNATIQGSSGLTLGIAGTTQGKLVLATAGVGSITLQAPSIGSNYSVSIPGTISGNDTFCLQTASNCSGGVSAIGALDGNAKSANGASINSGVLYMQSADGTYAGLVTASAQTLAGDKTLTGVLEVSNNAAVRGSGGLTVGGGLAGNQGKLVLYSGSAYVTLQATTGGGSHTLSLPAVSGNDTVCLLSLANCAGAGGGVTATGASNTGYIPRFTGNTVITQGSIYDPSGSGVSIGSTTVTGLLNVGTAAQFQVSNTGAVTAVGVNAGAGLLQGSLGLTVTGAAANLNTSSNFATNINTGTSTGAVTIGNSTSGGVVTVQSSTTIDLTGRLTLQPAASLTAGQIGFTQSLTNASSSGGTVTGYSQTLTVANSGSNGTTIGQSITVNDNNTNSLNNTTYGLSVSMGGSATSGLRIGIQSTTNKGPAVIATSTAASQQYYTCGEASLNYSLGLCAADMSTSNGGAGIYAQSSSRSSTTINSASGSAVYGVNSSSVGEAAGNFYGGVKGLALRTGNGLAYTTTGVYGEANAGNTATAYGGYFTLTAGSSAAAGAALYASNANTTRDILQLQDNATTVVQVADNGATLFKNSADSVNAFRIQNTASTNLFVMDTTGGNLITNGSFEVDTSGWAASGGGGFASITRGGSYGYYGSYQANLYAGGSTTNTYTYTLPGGAISGTYTISYYARYYSGGITNFSNNVNIAGGACNPGTLTSAMTSYTYFSCTATATGGSTVTITDTIGGWATFFFDGFKLESGSTATTYASGQATFNDTKLRVKNSSGTDIFLADAGAGRVLINQSTASFASSKLDVNGNINVTSGNSYYINGANINTAGTLTNVAYLNANNGFTGNNTFVGTSTFTGSGNGTSTYGALFRNTQNSATGFVVQNADAGNVLQVDTAAGNLIGNGSFEANTSGWVPAGGSGFAGLNRSTPGQYGSYGGTFTSGAGTSTFTYTLPGGAISGSYTISYYARYLGGGGNFSNNVNVAGGTCSPGTLTPAITTYTYYSCTVTAAGGSTVVITDTVGGFSSYYFDGFTLVAGSTALSFPQNSNTYIYGNSILRAQSNSTTTVQIQNSTGTNLLTADTTNMRVNVGSQGTATGQLYVSGSMATSAITADASIGSLSIAVSGRYAYIVPGNGTNGYIRSYDVSNPSSPTYINQVATTSNVAGKKIKIQGKYAYVAGGGYLQIFDITNPNAPTSVGSITYTSSGSFTSLYVQGRYAYVSPSGTQAIYIYDVANPANISLVYTLGSGNGYSTTTTGASDLYVQGDYLYAANNTAGTNAFQIIDISNPASPSVASSISTTNGSGASVWVQGRYAYLGTTNALYAIDAKVPTSISLPSPAVTGYAVTAITSQGRNLYLTDSTNNKVRTFDTAVPGTPTLISTSSFNATSPYALQAVGRYLYISTNAATQTIQTVDIGGAYMQQLEAGGLEADQLNVRGNTSFAGDASVQGSLSVGQHASIQGDMAVGGTSKFTGNLLANNYLTSTTATTTGTGTNTTTLTFTGTTSFANGDVIFIDNAGQDYFTRIVSGGSAASVTVSPEITFETGRTVTKYVTQSIGLAPGSTLATPAQGDRFFQGYFLGGVVVGASSTTLSDGSLQSSGNLKISAAGLNISAPITSPLTLQSSDTTGTALTFTANSLTSGKGLSISTTSANNLSGTLAVFDQTTTYNGVLSTSSSLIRATRSLTSTGGSTGIGKDGSGCANATNSGASFGCNITVNGGNAGRVIVAFVGSNGTNCAQGHTLTYNSSGQTFTLLGTAVAGAGTSGGMAMYYLLNPVGGTNLDITVNAVGGCSYESLTAQSWYGVETGSGAAGAFNTPGVGDNNSGGTGTGATAASGSGQVVVDGVWQYEAFLCNYIQTTTQSGQTATHNFNYAPSNCMFAGSSYRNSAGATTGMSWTAYNMGNPSNWSQVAVGLIPSSTVNALTVTGNVADISSNCTLGSQGGCTDSSNVLNLNQQYTGATGAVFNIQNSGTGAALKIQNGSSTTALQVTTTGSISTGWNAAASVLQVGSVGGRSINMAGVASSNGGDYAEWIPWTGEKPPAGTIIQYHGQSMVVSSLDTAAFVGNDKISGENSILVAFAGQLPVRITGEVNAGDYLVPNGDGTARGVSPSAASFTDYFTKVGTAVASGTDGTVLALVSGPGASSEFNPQTTGSFADLNITGGLTTNTLTVTGLATFQGNIIVGGHIITAGNTPDASVLAAAGSGATITIDGNDTAGTITITVGGGATAGDLGRLIFSDAYGKAPKTILSPQDEASHDAKIFPTGKSLTEFKLRTSQILQAGTYTFDYFIVQ